MVDTTQLFLAGVILALVVMLSVISVQVYFILKEFRMTLSKVNKVLDDTGTISESVSKPINMISTAFMGIKGGSALMKMFNSKKTENERE